MKEKVFNIVERLMIIVLFAVLIFGQSKHELWLDELDWSIGIVDSNSLKEVNKTVLKTGENLPLFYIILYFVKNIFGYNEWMLTFFTATLFTIVGILGIIKISDKLFYKEKRIYTIFFVFISYSIISQCGWQLRPYGLLFCFSAWMLYYYLEKIENPSEGIFIKYTIAMILLMYSHWFGVLISLIYAFIDFLSFMKKKESWKFIIPYIIAGLAFLPSFILLLKFHKSDIDTYGVDIPNLWSLFLIFFFLGENLILSTILLIGAIGKTFFIKKEYEKIKYIKVIGYSSILLIVLTYIYSRFINPSGSIIRNRYFSVLLPHAIILMVYGAIEIVEYFKKNNILKSIGTSLILCYIIVECFGAYYYIIGFPNHEGISNYKTWADYLYEQEDAYSGDTLIICTYGKTWIDYYFKNNNRELPKNIIGVDPLEIPNKMHMAEEEIDDFRYFIKDGKISNEMITMEEIQKYNKVYYLEEYRTMSDEMKEIFDEDKYELELIDANHNICKMEKINEE